MQGLLGDDLMGPFGSGATAPGDRVVSYALYPPPGSNLAEVRAACLQLWEPYLDGYLWQHDALTLTCSDAQAPPWVAQTRKGAPAAERGEPPCLWGVLRFGDNADDEWFVVWLLLEATRSGAARDGDGAGDLSGLAARVWDEDGEFLAIVASCVTPKWLKPETAPNRLWLYRGRVHLVPLPSRRAPQLPPVPSLAQALKILRSGTVDTLNERMDAAIRRHVSAYPAAARANMHTAHALLPLKAAHALRQRPSLISDAVAAFMARDPSDVRAAARMRHFPPRDMVTAAVRLSRCMLAQLRSQTAAPPKGWCPCFPPEGSPGAAAAQLGLMIATGLELVAGANAATDGGAVGAAAGPPSVAAADLDANPAWLGFRQSLQARGYFEGELPGSRRHRELLAAAVADFVDSDLYATSVAVMLAPAARLAAALAAAPMPPDAAAWESTAGPLPPEDSEAWMAEAEVRVTAELARRTAEEEQYDADKAARRGKRGSGGGARGGAGAGSAAAAPEVDAADLAAKLGGFLQHFSSFEGAEVPPELDDESGWAGGGLDLDPSRFLAALHAAVGWDADSGAPPPGLFGASEDDSASLSSSIEARSFFSDDVSTTSAGSSRSRGSGSGAAPESRGDAARPAAAGAQRGAAPSDAARASTAPLSTPAGETGGAARRWPPPPQWDPAWDDESIGDMSLDSCSFGSGSGFAEAYSQALDEELAGTSMGRTFERAAQHTPTEGRSAGGAAAAAAALPAGLDPVDVDLNLVKGVLESFTSQGGMPGPAGNLLGLLGCRLPTERAPPAAPAAPASDPRGC